MVVKWGIAFLATYLLVVTPALAKNGPRAVRRLLSQFIKFRCHSSDLAL